MRGGFEEEDFDSGRRRRDTELTLSSTTLLGIFFGMVLLCGLFFGLGYAVGRYAPSDSPLASRQSATAPRPAIVATAKAKPPATEQIAPQPQSLASSAHPPAPDAPAYTNAAPAASQARDASAASNAPPQVRPALPPPSASAATMPVLQPSLGPASGMMVQIAAVMNPEDADVLVEALRRRGYAVSIRRLPTDNLIHVQIGPFRSQDEANRWKQKLLNDGYNAVLMP